jgi:cellulose synthase/poly-beta-1,6-N-acetylglucosamine synthase-like glycosyltransferase
VKGTKVVALGVFIASAALLFYVYVGYPFLVTVCARQRERGREWQRATVSGVTVVFCAHNEADVLPEKITNCCALDYPADRLEFCVGSDGSTDETNALLQAWARKARVRLTLNLHREGKTTLLNRIVPTAKGDVVLFSDASTLFTPEAVRRHVAHYADPQVGCVGGDLEFVNTPHSPVSGAHGVYWRYESHLRQCESSLGTLAYVAGANYSMRRELWRTVAPHFADDCNSPLNVIEQGYRVVYDPRATAQEVAAESSEGLMRRRVRMVTRDLEATLARPALLNPLRFPGIAWSLWSHKILRWLGAPLLVVLFVSNLLLLERPLFQVILVLQVAFYALSLVGYWLQGKASSRWLSLPLYFSLSNLATLLGLVHILQRKRAATWQPGGRR